MLFQEHMLKFSACYEFVPGYYLIALDYLSVRDALHDIESLRVSEEDISCFFETWMSERGGNETHDLQLSKQAANHNTRPPAII